MSKAPPRDMGPCEAQFNTVSLGPTFGDVTFNSVEETVQVFESHYGKTPVDEIRMGKVISVIVPLTRSTLAQLADVITGATSGVGSLLVDALDVGVSMYDAAQELILKPIVNGVASTTASEWLYIYKAAPKEDMTIVYNEDGQRVFNVIFVSFPDQTSGQASRQWAFGTVA